MIYACDEIFKFSYIQNGYGGSAVINLVDGNEAIKFLKDYPTADRHYSSGNAGVPIGYTVRYLSDNKPADVFAPLGVAPFDRGVRSVEVRIDNVNFLVNENGDRLFKSKVDVSATAYYQFGDNDLWVGANLGGKSNVDVADGDSIPGELNAQRFDMIAAAKRRIKIVFVHRARNGNDAAT